MGELSFSPGAATVPSSNASTSFKFLPLGAIIQEFKVGDTNIVLNFDQQEDYAKYNEFFFGETIGRVANRVDGATIELDGKKWKLDANSGKNSLHGGNRGWGKQVWTGPIKVNHRGTSWMLFCYRSDHLDGGYPGALDVSVRYELTHENIDGLDITRLEIEYDVQFAEDVDDGIGETAVNMTNHSYFNISDQDSIEGTEVALATNICQEVREDSIPTGRLIPHPAIPGNGRVLLSKNAPVVDHCFVLETDPSKVPLDTRKLALRVAGTFYHPKTGIHLEVSSTEPGFQYYTGDYTDVPAVGGVPARKARSAFCVEPSRYVNAVNVPEWRGMTVLRRGQVYGSKIVYRAWRS